MQLGQLGHPIKLESVIMQVSPKTSQKQKQTALWSVSTKNSLVALMLNMTQTKISVQVFRKNYTLSAKQISLVRIKLRNHFLQFCDEPVLTFVHICQHISRGEKQDETNRINGCRN